MNLLKIGLIFVFAMSGLATTSKAAPFNQATVRRIIDGREVFIDRRPATVNESADRGQEISTGNSRAELLFDRHALGFLGTQSLIRLGEDCLRINRGQVLVNGPQNSCIGSKVLGIRGTTYWLSVRENGNYELAILSGNAIIGNERKLNHPIAKRKATDILTMYPRINPELGVGVSGWGSNASEQSLGAAAGAVLADASFFLPLRQVNGSNLLYSYTTANGNFDGIAGASSELGYKWLNPTDRSIYSLLIGYDGWSDGDCFHSQLAIGGLWEVNRWKFGASGGIPVDECNNNLGYAIGELGVPVADLGEQSVTLSFAPYLIHGIGNSYGGGRIGLNVPISNQLTVSAYGQYDDLLNTVIGGQVSYRFTPNGALVNDPNINQQSPSPPTSFQARRLNQGNQNINKLSNGNFNANQLIAETSSTIQSLHINNRRLAQSQNSISFQAGEIATFDSDGNLINSRQMSSQEFSNVIMETMRGQNLLPESNIIKLTYHKLYGKPDRNLLAILGSDGRFATRTPFPRLRGANNLIVPSNKLNNNDQKPTEKEISSKSKKNQKVDDINSNEDNQQRQRDLNKASTQEDNPPPNNPADTTIIGTIERLEPVPSTEPTPANLRPLTPTRPSRPMDPTLPGGLM